MSRAPFGETFLNHNKKPDVVLIGKPEIARHLQRLHFHEHRTLEELSQLIDCDSKTVTDAMDGKMSDRTQIRWSRILIKKKVPRILPENRQPDNFTGTKLIIYNKALKMWNLMQKHCKTSGAVSFENIKGMSQRELIWRTIEWEERVKLELMKKITRNNWLSAFLLDKYTVEDWIEQMQISVQDIPVAYPSRRSEA